MKLVKFQIIVQIPCNLGVQIENLGVQIDTTLKLVTKSQKISGAEMQIKAKWNQIQVDLTKRRITSHKMLAEWIKKLDSGP